MNSENNFFLSNKKKQRLFLLVSTVIVCSIVLKLTFADEPPRVVASIKPVHSLVSFVMQGVGKPKLLLKGDSSPHTFNIRPSTAIAIQEANVVFWVGKAMETSLADPLDALATDARVIALSTAEHLVIKPNRQEFHLQSHGNDHHETHENEADEHGHEDETHETDEHDHDHGSLDMHLWLDPFNAAHMVHMIAAKLSELNPTNAEIYVSNADAFEQRANQLMDEVSERLAPAKGVPFIVYHDAYRYFEESFGLTAAGSVLGSSHQPLSIFRVKELRKSVHEHDIKCVFSEPQFDPEKLNVVVEGSSARISTIDPLGANIEDGPELYFTLIENLAESFIKCLAVEG